MDKRKKGDDEVSPTNSHIITPQEFGRSLISPRDAFSGFYRHIGPNERPFTAEIIKMNNARLETWRDEILIPLSRDGMIEAEVASVSLKVFLEGFQVLQLAKEYDLESPIISELPEWGGLLENSSVKELWEMGATRVSMGFERFLWSLKMELAKEKYQKVYKLTDDPLEWYRLSQKHKHVFVGDYVSFGLTKERLMAIIEKATTILKTQINPYR